MTALRLARKCRRRGSPLWGWLFAVMYLAVASGLPMPRVLAGAKDTSQPFPCMYGSCGCASAGQCWASCCCHTKAELLAWAEEHQITPPSELLAIEGTPAEEHDHPESCCAPKPDSHGSCCSSSSSSPRLETKAPKTKKSERGVVLVDVLKCQGISDHWTGVAVSIPAEPLHWSISMDAEPMAPAVLSTVAPPRFCPPVPPPERATA